MKINTFVGLGSPGMDNDLAYRLHWKRAKETIDTMKAWDIHPKSILDIAGVSIVGRWIATDFQSKIHGTQGDLDYEWTVDGYFNVDAVICLEVIEHVQNPLKLLCDIKEKTRYKNLVVSWPERPHWLWTKHHFHEFDIDRFEYLADRAGMKVVNHRKYRMPSEWWIRFTGFRPFIRSFVSWQHIVELAVK